MKLLNLKVFGKSFILQQKTVIWRKLQLIEEMTHKIQKAFSWSENLNIIYYDLSGWNQLAEKC